MTVWSPRNPPGSLVLAWRCGALIEGKITNSPSCSHPRPDEDPVISLLFRRMEQRDKQVVKVLDEDGITWYMGDSSKGRWGVLDGMGSDPAKILEGSQSQSSLFSIPAVITPQVQFSKAALYVKWLSLTVWIKHIPIQPEVLWLTSSCPWHTSLQESPQPHPVQICLGWGNWVLKLALIAEWLWTWTHQGKSADVVPHFPMVTCVRATT